MAKCPVEEPPTDAISAFSAAPLTGTVLGTPAYLSCEQASGMKSDEHDARSDIQSLGVVASYRLP